jgi:hypothetical protein
MYWTFAYIYVTGPLDLSKGSILPIPRYSIRSIQGFYFAHSNIQSSNFTNYKLGGIVVKSAIHGPIVYFAVQKYWLSRRTEMQIGRNFIFFG